MIRALLLTVLIAACVAAAGVITVTAAHASPVPDDLGSDCSWAEDGTTITVGDETYTCHCAELVGPMGPQVLCRWWNVDKLPAKDSKPAKKIAKPKSKLHAKPKPKIRVYPKPAVVA